MPNLVTNYYRQHIATICILVSSYLMIEHIWSFGGINLYDLIGHEWYAILLFIFAVIIVPKLPSDPSDLGIKIKNWFSRRK